MGLNVEVIQVLMRTVKKPVTQGYIVGLVAHQVRLNVRGNLQSEVGVVVHAGEQNGVIGKQADVAVVYDPGG